MLKAISKEHLPDSDTKISRNSLRFDKRYNRVKTRLLTNITGSNKYLRFAINFKQ